MEYSLTSSQKIFYKKNFDDSIWTQGVMQIFPSIYSYRELNDAFNTLVRTNESLLVNIKEKNGKPIAELGEFSYTEYPYVKCETEEEAIEYFKAFLKTPININERLVTCVVFSTPVSSGIMVNAHHIIVDAFSAFVMSKRIESYLNHTEYTLPPYQSYHDYIENEIRYKNSKRYLSDRNFWLKEFENNPVTTILHHSGGSLSYEASEKDLIFPGDLFDRIKNICDSYDISIGSFFNAVYAAYIYNKWNVTNFTLGVPVLNRTTQVELNTVGLYMNIVPLVLNLELSETFFENAQKIENSQMNLFRHQRFSQHDIKELLKDRGYDRLFDIGADYEELEHFENYDVAIYYSNAISVPMEIHFFNTNDDKRKIKIRYRTALFTENDIHIMLNSIMAIIEDVLENPGKKFSELEMISAHEKQKVIYTFNDTKHSYNIPEESTIYSLFEETVKENRDKTCIKTADKNLTFGEFANIAERLDVKIRKITDSKKSVIAVIAERSIEMYAAIYGIIRGGNAYLPIDPEYPKDRIEYILKNSKAEAAVTQGKFVALAGNTPCIDLTALIEKKPKNISDIPACSALPDDTAYVIYTSGSTGAPKGAKVSHKSAVNRILWMHDKYPLDKEDVILQKTPYTFDVSVWEHFWWGMCGGSLAVSKPGEHFLPAKILEEISENKVTHIHFVPSVFELFLNYLEAHKEEIEKFNTVKYVFLSGEALTAGLIERFYKIYDYENVSIHNLYGPTECAVDVSYYDCAPGDIDPVPIGSPIYNTQLYVVDQNIKPVPIGETGELCIAGINVGQGYLNNPDLTAEKFIDNPFGDGKLYKTGDNAYWCNNGSLIFCGRRDSQIKLNGQRIEIGEIEAVISSIDEIESVAVIVRQAKKRDVIVAFYSGKNISETAIKAVCQSKLPKYMVPSFVVHLEALPLNQNGKLDRRALAGMEINIAEVEIEKPVDDMERHICRVFEEILDEKNIGRNSDFFELGGTSLSMISLLSKECFENITATEFMRNSTPSALAMLMSGKKTKKAECLEVLYVPENPKKALILLPFAGGGAESFSNFVVSLKKFRKDTAVYFIRYLHSFEECDNAADEISDTLKDTEIMFYSHCVGSAVALQIISRLEKKGIPIEHYFAAASIPPAKPTIKNFWNVVSDKLLKTVLVNAGAEFGGFSHDDISLRLKQFRKDTDFANISYSEMKDKIKTPVCVILCKKDFFTFNYRQCEKLWKKYATHISDILYIDGKNHYFQTENSDALIKFFPE